MKNDGISVIALVIALLLLSSVGFVFSSLIITKQKSAPLPLRSAQAFYLAQAGIEYAIRYTADNYTDFQADPDNIFPLQKNIGAGSFNVTYDAGDNITSNGTAGIGQRVITLASFLAYVAGAGVTLDPGNPPYQDPAPGKQKNICVPTLNNYDYNVYIFQIDLAKEGAKRARLEKIRLGDTTVWIGNKKDVSTNPDSPTLFSFNQVTYYTMVAGAWLDGIEVKAAAEVSGTWHLTFHYSKQTDLSNPETSTIIFVIS